MSAMLSDRYADLEPIGEGVSAKVYRARDTHTSSVVAIKVINPYLATDPVSLERFRREIQITRFLGHPQIVAIYDLVEDGERIYLVMEYLEGENLKALVQRRGPLAIDAAVDVLTQTLRILSLCHAKHVIHRDLKPQNMIVAPSGLVKLLDFGISRMTTLSDLTQTGTSLGSPEYMAPELFVGNAYDPRTDLYALGVVLFELLAGRLPFQGDSLPVLYQQHVAAPVPALRKLRTDVPEWLEHLTERLLAKRPSERYQSADEVLDDVTHRRVIARRLPSLARRDCVSCRAATLADLPWCTLCGYDLSVALGRGRLDVRSAETTDRAALARFLGALLGRDAPKVRRGATVLVSGLDAASAELFRRSALERGLVLTVERRSSVASLKRLGALLAFAVCALTAAMNVARSLMPFDDPLVSLRHYDADIGLLPQQAFLFTVVRAVAFVLLSWCLLGVYRRQAGRAILRDLPAVRARLSAECGWLRELAPVAAGAAGESVAQMIEKYLLLARGGVALDAGLRGALQRVLRGAAEVACLAAEIHARLDAATLARLATAWTSLADQVQAEDVPARRQALERRRSAIGGELEAAATLQDAYERLLNRLTRLQCVFNALLGKALVLNVPLAAQDVETLEASLQTLREDLAVGRQVHAELGRAA